IGVAGFQLGELCPKNEIAGRAEAKDQVDPACPTCLSEITHHAHHGRDTHPPANEDDTFCLFPGEVEGPIRCFDLNLAANFQLIVQPVRHEAVILPFHRDLYSVPPCRRRCNCVGTLGWDTLRRNMESQELTGKVIERDLSSAWRPKAERLHV